MRRCDWRRWVWLVGGRIVEYLFVAAIVGLILSVALLFLAREYAGAARRCGG